MNTNFNIKAFLIFFIFLHATTSNSKDLSFSCENNKVNYLHVNGINTTLTQAVSNKDSLRSFLISNGIENSSAEVKLVYNQSNGFFLDLIEAYHQKIDKINKENIETKDKPFLLFFSYSTVSINYFIGKLLSFYEYDILSSASNFIGSKNYIEDKLATDSALREAFIQERGLNKKIMFIPHSQGNSFVSELFQKISKEELNETRVVHVASPETIFYGPQVIYSYDIIKLLSNGDTYNPGILNRTDFDILGHDFQSVYLNGLMSQHLSSTIFSEKDSFKKDKERNKISFALSWSQQKDLDLQVIEPDGTHVYHYRLKGNFGKLNGDIKQAGKEIYEMPCGVIKDGMMVKIATNTTYINSNDGSFTSPARLELNFAGKKVPFDINADWQLGFKNEEPQLTMIFKKQNNKSEDMEKNKDFLVEIKQSSDFRRILQFLGFKQPSS